MEAILFDFDGTLVDFVDSDIQSLRWLHGHTGVSVPFDDFLETAVAEIMKFHELVVQNQIDPLLMHSFRLQNAFRRYQINWDETWVQQYQHQLIRNCSPFPGVVEMLQIIQTGVKLGVVTNAYDGQEQRARIKNSGLDKFFDCIVVAGEVGVYKPDPDLFLQAVQLLNTTPGQTIFVGDSPKYDIAGAMSAGLQTVLVTRNTQPLVNKADYTVQSIDSLTQLLQTLIT